MKLKLDLQGILFSLEISNYHQSTKENWDDEWCKVSYYVMNGVSLNYGMNDKECLLCTEIEEIRDTFKKLLLDELTEETELSFVESDFTFHITPKTMDYQITLLDPYPQVSNAYADLKIHFWDDGLTSNYLNLRLDEEEIEYIKNYLNLITGMVDKTNPVIEDMINREIILY